MNIVIIHHDDLDGRTAAAIAYREELKNGNNITCYEMDYDKELPKLPSDTDKIYILDFSFKRDILERLIRFVGRENIVWLDHHESVMRELMPEYSDLNGQRTAEWCGTMLTWLYFHPTPLDKIPYLVKLVDDNDRWILAYGDDTLGFLEYSFGLDLKNISGNDWDKLLSKSEKEFESIVEYGRDLLRRRRIELKELIEKAGFPMRVIWEGKGYSCMKINSSYIHSASLLGDIIYKELEYDIAHMTYHKMSENGELLKVHQLRSTKVDVSRISQKFGGGGHTNAAGWTTRTGKMLKDSVEVW